MSGISQHFAMCQKELWGNEKQIESNISIELYAKSIVNLYQQHQLDGAFMIVAQEGEVNFWDQKFLT